MMGIKGSSRPSAFLSASSSFSITPEHPCSKKYLLEHNLNTLPSLSHLTYTVLYYIYPCLITLIIDHLVLDLTKHNHNGHHLFPTLTSLCHPTKIAPHHHAIQSSHSKLSSFPRGNVTARAE